MTKTIKIIWWILLGLIFSQILQNFKENNYLLFGYDCALLIYVLGKIVKFNIELTINQNINIKKDDTSKSIKN